MTFRLRSGQALVVVLLILGVVTTVALSIASRTVTEVGVSTGRQEAAQALAAAETGVEAKLSGSTVTSGSVGTATYSVNAAASGGAAALSVDQLLAAGESVAVFLPGYTGNSIGVCWGGGNLQTAYYYRQGGVTKVNRNYYTSGGNTARCPGDGRSYASYRSVSLPAGVTPQFIKLKLLNNGDVKYPVAVITGGGGTFPAQGTDITAVGRAGESVRKIKVFDQTPDVPEVFTAGLFSGSKLGK